MRRRVLGFPWSIPFEFPIYQWLMVLARYAGIPFDIGGRLISFGFYIACLWPLWSLTRSLKLDSATFIIIVILFLCCPLYVFYSRTIMIESCALFFGMAWLAALARFLGRPSYGWLLGTIVLGSLAVLAKSTTFSAFVFLGGLLMLSALFRSGEVFRQLPASALWFSPASPVLFRSLSDTHGYYIPTLSKPPMFLARC